MRRIAVAVFLGGGMGLAQSTLPAIGPTATPVSSTAAAASAGPATAAKAGHPPQVIYAQGLLEVTADDSSLSQILREISRQTGMKVSGGVADERVFGKYGPAAAADVLASLLDGTNTNMLLQETASSVPEELILTPREGGATPPDLNGAASNNGAASSPQSASQATAPDVEDRPAQMGPPRPPYGGGAFGMSPTNSAPDPSAPGPHPTNPNYQPRSGPVGPGGAQTPQQVYQQLQQMQPTPQP